MASLDPITRPEHRVVRVLIVEDNPVDAELMVAVLKRAGLPLAFDRVDQLAAFEQALRQKDYDVILCDHNLRTWTGLEALELLRKSGRDIPLIVVTAVLGDEAAVDYIKQGAADYVIKHRLERLPVAIRQALRDKAHREEEARLKEQVVAAKREWELTFDSVCDPILILDPQGRVQRANRASAEITGRKFSDLIGRPCLEAVGCREVPEAECSHRQTMRTGRAAFRDVHGGQNGRWFSCSSNPRLGSDGTLAGSIVVLHDITERRAAEEALRASEERFRTAFHAIPDPIGITSLADGRYVDVNPAFERLTELRREEVMGRKPEELGILVNLEARAQLVREVMEGRAVEDREIEVRAKSGALRTVLVAATPIDLAGQRCVMISGPDITLRKRAEELRAAAYRISELAKSAQTLDQVFRSTHEIVNELMPAKNFFIALYDATAAILSFSYYVDERDPLLPPRRLEKGFTEYILRTGKSLHASREVFEELVKAGKVEPRGTPPQDRVGVPLKIEGQAVGVLVVQTYEAGARYGEEEKAALEFISDQIAMAIQRKRAEQERHLLQSITQTIGMAESLTAALRSAMQVLCQATGWTLGQIWLPNSDGTSLEASLAWYGSAPSVAEFRTASQGLAFSPGQGLPGRAWSTKQRVWAFDGRFEDDIRREAAAHTAGFSSGMAMPILAGEEIVGVMEFFSCRTHPHDQGLLEVVSSVAAQLGSAVLRKRAEAENVRLLTSIEQSAEAVVMTDVEGAIEYVNPAFSRITGYSREEALGQNTRFLKSDKQEPEFYRQLWTTILSGEVWHGELVNRRKDGNLYTEEMNITPVRSSQGEITHFIALKQDVTKRKQLEQQLSMAQRMETVGKLAGGVAHDFNNLVTVISGYSQLLLSQLHAEDPLREFVEEIQGAGERATALTRQLLAFSRRQVLEPQVLSLNAVLTNLEKMLRRLIGEDVELITVLHPDLGRVKADSGQIEQVIMNLAVNARDAMPGGGKLTIETANVELDADYATHHVSVKPGPYVMLAVSDTGVGMDKETQSHIFEPFFTTKEMGRGTGLGLSTVYGIVKQSGGNIWVYSEPEQGAVFKIYLPRVEDAAETLERGRLAPAERMEGKETILLVEDEDRVRKLARRILESAGYHVLAAARGEEAMQIFKQRDGKIHLLLTDVVMPQMNGRDLARQLAAELNGMKVLYISGYTDDAVIRHGTLEPGMAFLQKPFTAEALLRKVRQMLDG